MGRRSSKHSTVPPLSHRERLLAMHLQLEQRIQQFLRRVSSPRRQYPRLEQALEEVNHARLVMQPSTDRHGE